jgi:hypothetical protein
MTTIACTADLHENLIDIPGCELLLIAGDVSFAFKGDLYAKQAFLAGSFREWLDEVPAEEIVLVAGNHDQSIEAWGVPDGLRCHYLQDHGIELFGLKLWGTPWQPWFFDWAFNAPRRNGEDFLASKFDPHPRGHRHRDRPRPAPWIRRPHAAARRRRARRLDRDDRGARPRAARLMVCGHIHPGYGRYRRRETEIINASLVDNDYRPVNPVVKIVI